MKMRVKQTMNEWEESALEQMKKRLQSKDKAKRGNRESRERTKGKPVKKTEAACEGRKNRVSRSSVPGVTRWYFLSFLVFYSRKNRKGEKNDWTHPYFTSSSLIACELRFKRSEERTSVFVYQNEELWMQRTSWWFMSLVVGKKRGRAEIFLKTLSTYAVC